MRPAVANVTRCFSSFYGIFGTFGLRVALAFLLRQLPEAELDCGKISLASCHYFINVGVTFEWYSFNFIVSPGQYIMFEMAYPARAG